MNHLGRHNSEATLELPENGLSRGQEFQGTDPEGTEGKAVVSFALPCAHGIGNRSSGGVVEPVTTLSQLDSIF